MEPATKQPEVTPGRIRSTLSFDELQSALETLSETTWKTALDFKALAHATVQQCKIAVQCKDVAIWEVDAKQNWLTTVACTANVNVDMHVGNGIAGNCLLDSNIIVFGDLRDPIEVSKYSDSGLAHSKLVTDRNWRGAVFVPLDFGGYCYGVLASYADTPNYFEDIYVTIINAFANRLVGVYLPLQKLNEISTLKANLQRIAPAMETALDAVGHLHDANQELFEATGSLSMIKGNKKYRDNTTKHIREAKRLIKAFQNQVKYKRLAKMSLRLRNVHKFLDPICSQAKIDAEGKDITLTYSCPKNLNCKFDKWRMRRVLRNLIENSIDFIERKSQANKRRITIRAEQTSGHVLISIYDTGIGIPPEHKHHVFDLFFTTKGEEGFGLGLSLAKKHVEAHGGKLTFESRHGEFTEFQIRLPRESNGS